MNNSSGENLADGQDDSMGLVAACARYQRKSSFEIAERGVSCGKDIQPQCSRSVEGKRGRDAFLSSEIHLPFAAPAGADGT